MTDSDKSDSFSWRERERATGCRDVAGGLGAAPPVMRSGERVASRARNSPFPKKAPQGHFFPFTGPAKRPVCVTVSVSTGASIRTRSRRLSGCPSPTPDGGRRRRRRGAPSPPPGCPGPYPGRDGGRWGRKRPDCCPDGLQSAASAAPLSLR